MRKRNSRTCARHVFKFAEMPLNVDLPKGSVLLSIGKLLAVGILPSYAEDLYRSSMQGSCPGPFEFCLGHRKPNVSLKHMMFVAFLGQVPPAPQVRSTLRTDLPLAACHCGRPLVRCRPSATSRPSHRLIIYSASIARKGRHMPGHAISGVGRKSALTLVSSSPRVSGTTSGWLTSCATMG